MPKRLTKKEIEKILGDKVENVCKSDNGIWQCNDCKGFFGNVTHCFVNERGWRCGSHICNTCKEIRTKETKKDLQNYRNLVKQGYPDGYCVYLMEKK